jgi:hypothetical protein
MSKRLADALNTALNADTPGTVNAEDIYPSVPVPFKRRAEANPEQFKALQAQVEAYQAQLKQALVRTDNGIQIAGCIGNAAGLLVPDDISAEDMHLLADVLFDFEGRIQLFIGDMLNAVEKLQYGTIQKIAEAYGRDETTLYNWKSICKAVTTSLRSEVLAAYPNKPALTIGHFALVRAMPEDEQRHWLMQAAEQQWSVAKLRDAIKGKALLPAENATLSLFDKSHMPRPAALEPLYRKARQGDKTALAEIQRHIAEYEKWLRAIQESLGLR